MLLDTSTDQSATSNVASAAEPKPKKTGFRGTPNPHGRPKGISNKNTIMLKQAILLAAEAVGSDGKGKDALVGYLTSIAKIEPVAFCSLLGKVLPLTIQGDKNNPLVHHVKVSLVRSAASEAKVINAKVVEQKR